MKNPTPPSPTARTAARIALVTGASRGLGFALAEALAAAGWHVLAVARTVGGLEELDDRIRAAGGSATLAPMDITDAEAMAHLAGSIAERWGGLGLWVHAAIHAAPLAPAGHLDLKDFDKSAACNIRATAALIPLIEPLLRAADGTALFFDDPRGGEKFFGSYGASKAAQVALARTWQAECAKIGPRVLIETPSAMPTATRGRFFPGEDRATLRDPRDEAKRLLALLQDC
ncbi:MAG: SDR family NAD(P)-dependent oxidoreductase [Rhodobacteraceae bacterium]|nr:SDR family NAD(P)-dependent oxidoreductase [Paracoccaceae bacterium]